MAKLTLQYTMIVGLILGLCSCTSDGFKKIASTQPGESTEAPSSDGDDAASSDPATPFQGFNPSEGSGGTAKPGQSFNTNDGSKIYVPLSYAPSQAASAVIILFNLNISHFKSAADQDNAFIIDTESYNDRALIYERAKASLEHLSDNYNIDLARLYIAGYSAGGNLALLDYTSPDLQKIIAGIMVFPGSGGQFLLSNLGATETRKIAIHYAVGDQDTQTGFYPGVITEAQRMQQVPGYENRIDYKVWPGVDHSLPQSSPEAIQSAWNWIKQFNTMTN